MNNTSVAGKSHISSIILGQRNRMLYLGGCYWWMSLYTSGLWRHAWVWHWISRLVLTHFHFLFQ